MGRRSSADAKWLQQVRRSGTTSDKVAALSVLLQDGAAANLPALDGLLSMCGKKGGARAVVGSAMDALRELFIAVLLPERKLRFFEQQPLAAVPAGGGGREGERRLLYWLVEDGVKKRCGGEGCGVEGHEGWCQGCTNTQHTQDTHTCLPPFPLAARSLDRACAGTPSLSSAWRCAAATTWSL